MNESKIELTERLRREGRWEEATRFKDEVLRKLRSDGMTKADAAEEAWRRMAAQYPPLANIGESVPEAPDATAGEPWPTQRPRGTEHDTEHDIDIDALLDRIGDGRPSDLVQDTLWVYENLANRRIKASDAPSCGAWALLEWARQYRNRFFEQVLPKAMLSKPPEDEKNEREEKKSIAELQKMLEKVLRETEEEMIRDLQENTSLTIRAKVHEIVKEWEDRCKVPLADDARKHLEAHFGRFAQTCIYAGGGTLESSTAP